MNLPSAASDDYFVLKVFHNDENKRLLKKDLEITDIVLSPDSKNNIIICILEFWNILILSSIVLFFYDKHYPSNKGFTVYDSRSLILIVWFFHFILKTNCMWTKNLSSIWKYLPLVIFITFFKPKLLCVLREIKLKKIVIGLT